MEHAKHTANPKRVSALIRSVWGIVHAAYTLNADSVYQCLIKHAKHTAYAKRIAELEGVQIPHNLLSCNEVERVLCVYVLTARSRFVYTFSCVQCPE
jgi:hypothetical protein